ncbi:MAG: hypothetical protein PHS49_07430 [Candidatus Gracilibacteria bacterium]|nr:hypothetical protein [Candidatus Gracilibacteria bacterium]
MNEKIKKVIKIITKLNNYLIYNSIPIAGITGKQIILSKNYLDKDEFKVINELLKYMNNDYIDIFLEQFSNIEYKIGIKFKKGLKNNGIINDKISFWIEDDLGYYFVLSIKGSCYFSLSGLLKYYVIDNRYYDSEEKIYKEYKDYEMIKLLEQFFIERGYIKLTKKLGETELDIDGEDFHSLERHKEIQKNYYNLYFGKTDELYFDGKDGREKVNTKKQDLEKFMLLDYNGPFKVKHLLFGESFVGEIID